MTRTDLAGGCPTQNPLTGGNALHRDQASEHGPSRFGRAHVGVLRSSRNVTKPNYSCAPDPPIWSDRSVKGRTLLAAQTRSFCVPERGCGNARNQRCADPVEGQLRRDRGQAELAHRPILVAQANSRVAVTDRNLETNANRLLHWCGHSGTGP
jgi:hypothetical protein